jgi:hypothetical protein
MVATYSLLRKNLKDNTYVTEPNYAMRTSVAWKFLATFAQEILSPKHKNKLTEAKDYHLTNSSPACNLFLHAFQNWVYTTTKGQLTLTEFKGYPPMIRKPNIIDLNPS